MACCGAMLRSDAGSLLEAAKSGDVKAVNEIMSRSLASGAWAVAKSSNWGGQTAFHVAARYGHADALRAMIKPLANARASDLPPALARAAGGGDAARGDGAALLSRVACVIDGKGLTALMLACIYGHAAAAGTLVAAGANPFTLDSLGRSALHYAASLGHAACIAEVLAAYPGEARREWFIAPPNASNTRLVDVRNECGFTPLHYAVWAESTDAVMALASFEPHLLCVNDASDGDWINVGEGYTPLHLAAMKGDYDLVRLLLAIHCQSMSGGAEVMAAPRGHWDSRYVDDVRHVRNKRGLMSYHVAMTRGYEKLGELLHPDIPYTYIFANDDIALKTRLYGAPRLSVLAAAVLQAKLLAELAAVEAGWEARQAGLATRKAAAEALAEAEAKAASAASAKAKAEAAAKAQAEAEKAAAAAAPASLENAASSPFGAADAQKTAPRPGSTSSGAAPAAPALGRAVSRRLPPPPPPPNVLAALEAVPMQHHGRRTSLRSLSFAAGAAGAAPSSSTNAAAAAATAGAGGAATISPAPSAGLMGLRRLSTLKARMRLARRGSDVGPGAERGGGLGGRRGSGGAAGTATSGELPRQPESPTLSEMAEYGLPELDELDSRGAPRGSAASSPSKQHQHQHQRCEENGLDVVLASADGEHDAVGRARLLRLTSGVSNCDAMAAGSAHPCAGAAAPTVEARAGLKRAASKRASLPAAMRNSMIWARGTAASFVIREDAPMAMPEEGGEGDDVEAGEEGGVGGGASSASSAVQRDISMSSQRGAAAAAAAAAGPEASQPSSSLTVASSVAAAWEAPVDEICDICFDAPAVVNVLKCHHHMCLSCTRELTQVHHHKPALCPFCRRMITQYKLVKLDGGGAGGADGA